MAAPTQLGEQLEVGIGEYTYTGYIVQAVDFKPTGDERKVKGEDGATATRILTDLGNQVVLDLVCKAGSDPTTLAKGDTITLNSVPYCLDDAGPVRRAGQEMTVRITASKEDSMTYS